MIECFDVITKDVSSSPHHVQRLHNEKRARLLDILLYRMASLLRAQSLPVTSMRFRPAVTQSKTRNVLVSCNAAGEIQHWHITSGA